MNLACPNCRRPLAAEDVDLPTSIGRCTDCSRVFHLYDQIRAETEVVEAKPRAPAPQPPRFTIARAGGDVDIRYAWRTAAGAIFLAFSAVWFGFLFFWYTGAIESGNLFMLLFPLIHVAAGGFIAYKGLSGTLNRTHIALRRDSLRVTNGPIPTFVKDVDIPRQELDQIFVQLTYKQHKNGTTTLYNLRAREKSGEVRPIAELRTADEAVFLEQEIERFFGIRDREIGGEMSR